MKTQCGVFHNGILTLVWFLGRETLYFDMEILCVECESRNSALVWCLGREKYVLVQNFGVWCM